jgi:hypothetical protein
MSSGDAIRKWTAAGLLAGAVLAASGCGESPTTSLSAGRAARWHDTIAGIRTAAAAADRPTALAALTRLSGYVDRDAHAGQLTVADAAALRAGIARARRHLPQQAATPVAASALATAAATTAAAPSAAATSTRPATGSSRPRPSSPPPAATPPPPPAANTKDDAKAQKDAAKAQKDAAKAQKKQAKAQPSGAVVLPNEDAAPTADGGEPRSKAEPKKVKAPKAGDQGVQE